ncbi:MAG: DUF1707 domain-containing protein [Propionibacteriaceae bacterium]|jgi:hypothetical protein|nr:DUF1707 domain-containing protein [Propionibacteriaceae bacterium]
MSYEPMDVGPLYGGDRPILPTDRQLVVDLLTAAHADSRLTDWDFSMRMNAVNAARTFDDLIPLTRDLMTP